MATLHEVIAVDACHHVPGDNLLSGDHKGREEILAMYAKIGELTQGRYSAQLEQVYANDHRAVAIYRSQGTRDGTTVDERAAMCFEILDGKAMDIDEMPLNGEVNDAFWS